MTCTNQGGSAAPIADGSRFRHKITGRRGVILTRTIEAPPRYVALFENNAGGCNEGLALHHEIEVETRDAPAGMFPNPFGAALFAKWQSLFPLANAGKAAAADQKAAQADGIEWDGLAAGVPYYHRRSKCGRFSVCQQAGGHYDARDRAGMVKSPPFDKPGAAMAWCRERANDPATTKADAPTLDAELNATLAACGVAPIPTGLDGQVMGPLPGAATMSVAEAPTLAGAPGMGWKSPPHLTGSVSDCARFSTTRCTKADGSAYWFATDNRVQDNHGIGAPDSPARYSPDCATEDQARTWCEARARFNVATGANGNVELVPTSVVPF